MVAVSITLFGWRLYGPEGAHSILKCQLKGTDESPVMTGNDHLSCDGPLLCQTYPPGSHTLLTIIGSIAKPIELL
jgi:hypothetical protein